MTRREVVDDLELLLAIFSSELQSAVRSAGQPEHLIELVLDLGRPPQARFIDGFLELRDEPVTQEEIDLVLKRVGDFGADNRAGLERTLHRIAAVRNRKGKTIGLTCRVGRAVFGTLDIVADVARSGKSVLLLGRPGVGKTTLLREMARVSADGLLRRVVIVDTSNEIAGDGDVPHPAIGSARRLQVPSGVKQADVMIEAVENHNPQVIVIDEIGTTEEAAAARTIAERGVQLVGTAHGNTLENLVFNPTLADLVGGVQVVTLGDEEARRRGTKKTVLERKAPPTFQVVIEIQERDRFAIHPAVDEAVDVILSGEMPQPEVRVRNNDGSVFVENAAPAMVGEAEDGSALPGKFHPSGRWTGGRQTGRVPKIPRIYSYAVNRNRLERAVRQAKVPLQLTDRLAEADIMLTLRSHYRKLPKRLRDAEQRGLPVHVIRSNTSQQIENWINQQASNVSQPQQV